MPVILPPYSEQLKDPRWKAKRDEVFALIGLHCESCNTRQFSADIHHKYYVGGKLAWEYPLSAFRVLCRNCHDLTEEAIQQLREAFGPFDYWEMNAFSQEFFTAADEVGATAVLKYLLLELRSIKAKSDISNKAVEPGELPWVERLRNKPNGNTTRGASDAESNT